MSTTSHRKPRAKPHTRALNFGTRIESDPQQLTYWLEKVDGRFMGLPIEVDPHDAILHCINVMAGEAAYCDQQIMRLEHDEVFERPTTVTYGREDGIERYEVRRDAEIVSRWVTLRDQALERMAKYAKMALDAGVEERRVQLAERVASVMEPLLKNLAEDLQLTPEQQKQLPVALGTRLRALEGTATTIGESNGRRR